MTKKCVFVAMFGGAITLLVLWFSGFFSSGIIESGRIVPTRTVHSPGITVAAEKVIVPVIYEAVGTVRPETEAAIEAQVTGKVVKVLVHAGNKVRKGDKLIELDSREFKNRLESSRQGLMSAQARQRQAGGAINAARAEADTATATWKRMKTLLKTRLPPVTNLTVWRPIT